MVASGATPRRCSRRTPRIDTRAAAAAATARRRECPGRRAAGAGSCRDCATTPVDRCRSSHQSAAWISDSPDAFLHACPRRDRGRERRPQVVVLAHRVVEPAHVRRVADGVARIAEGDHLVDTRATSADQFAAIRRERAAEAEVGGHDEMRVVSLLASGRDERSGDDEMPAFSARRTGGDDGEDGHRLGDGRRNDAVLRGLGGS